MFKQALATILLAASADAQFGSILNNKIGDNGITGLTDGNSLFENFLDNENVILNQGLNCNGVSVDPSTVTPPASKTIYYTLVSSCFSAKLCDECPTQMLCGYNGTIPGPTLEGNIGDTMIINMKNSFPFPTTTHWHGVDTTSKDDGTPFGHTPIPPGGNFTYTIELNRAATSWYHPHMIRSSIYKGSSGFFIIRDPTVDINLPTGDNDMEIAFADVLLRPDGMLREDIVDQNPFTGSALTRATISLNGRLGNQFLMNGAYAPMSGTLKEGIPIRMRFLNGSPARWLRFSFPGQDVYRIAAEVGLIPEPYLIKPVTLLDEPGRDPIPNPDPTVGHLLSIGERVEFATAPKGPEFIVETWDIERNLYVVSEGSSTRSLFGTEDMTPKQRKLLTFNNDYPYDGLQAREILIKWKVEASVAGCASYTPPSNLVTFKELDPYNPSYRPMNLDPIVFNYGFKDTLDPTNGQVSYFGSFDNMTMFASEKTAPEVLIYSTRFLHVYNFVELTMNFHFHGFEFQHKYTEYYAANGTLLSNETAQDPFLRDSYTLFGAPEKGGFSKHVLVTEFGVEGENRGPGKSCACRFNNNTEAVGRVWINHNHILEHGAAGLGATFQVVGPECAHVNCTGSTPE